MRSFASDNYAGRAPGGARRDQSPPTSTTPRPTATTRSPRSAERLFRREFGEHARVLPVFNGTGANVTALQLMLRRHEAVVCAGRPTSPPTRPALPSGISAAS